MIGVQKRKATCQQATIATSNNGQQQVQQTSLANKRPRKRAKISSSSVNLSNKNNKQQACQQYQQTFDNNVSTIQQQNNGDESVWIFGLMNNIEQLLSTFSAINNGNNLNHSPHSLSSSSTSSPSSSASISALSSPASTTSSTPSYSSTNNKNTNQHSTINSHSQTLLDGSNLSKNNVFSTTNSSKPTSSTGLCQPQTHQQQHKQQTGPLCQGVAANQLPRSPISRQIKFHEYKGPPSSKRQQQFVASTNSSNTKQQQQQVKATPKTTTNFSNTSTTAQINSNQQTKAGNSEKKSIVLDGANITTMVTNEQMKSSVSINQQPNPSINYKIEASKTPISTETAATTTKIITTANKPRAQQQQLQALLVSNKAYSLGSYTSLKQQQQQSQSQSLAVNHFQDLNQSFSIPTQTHTTQQQARQAGSSIATSRVTSGPHFVQQQQQANRNSSFYGDHLEQQATNFETPSDGPIVLLAPPFIESKLELQVQPELHHRQQLQPLFQQTRNQVIPCSSSRGAGSSVELGSVFMRSLDSIPLIMDQQQSISGQEFRLCVPMRQQQQYQLVQQPTMRQVEERVVNHQQEQQIDSFELANFNSNTNNFQSKFYTENCLDNQISTNTASTFNCAASEDSEEHSTDEIEPSISFSQGVDELLFSEFIDLQDVPMNVDESDWLKKFLPPCSMG